MKPLFLSGLLAVLGVLLPAGCESVPAAPFDEAVLSAPTDETFVALDQGASAAVECAGFFTRTRPDGRLEVVVNLRNTGEQSLRLAATCVFRVGEVVTRAEEIRTIVMAPAAVETVRFTAGSADAKTGTVFVRVMR